MLCKSNNAEITLWSVFRQTVVCRSLTFGCLSKGKHLIRIVQYLILTEICFVRFLIPHTTNRLRISVQHITSTNSAVYCITFVCRIIFSLSLSIHIIKGKYMPHFYHSVVLYVSSCLSHGITWFIGYSILYFPNTI